jgi:hypothetical protein
VLFGRALRGSPLTGPGQRKPDLLPLCWVRSTFYLRESPRLSPRSVDHDVANRAGASVALGQFVGTIATPLSGDQRRCPEQVWPTVRRNRIVYSLWECVR